MNFMEGRPGFCADAEDKGGAAAAPTEREHMFDKVVTPSDVGKLNRLVIPKQHAEKYFPLDSSSSAEKGLLLNFEDNNGKSWRFRYSYWNSSQSYVMTKGWSRFVKEKKLDAGDIVSFHRASGDRLFIDWRRRPDHHLLPPPSLYHSAFHQSRPSATFFRPQPPPHYFHYSYNGSIVTGSPCPPGSIMYLRPPPTPAGVWPHSGSSPGHLNPQQMVFESVPVVQGKVAAAKRLRLFGVNMDCPASPDDLDDVNILEVSSNHSNGVGDCDILLHSSPLPPFIPSSSSSSSTSSSLARFRPDYEQDKGKASMSLDLDI